MASPDEQLGTLLNRAREVEILLAQVQSQFAEIKSSAGNSVDQHEPQKSSQSSAIVAGKYTLFLKGEEKVLPYDVLGAYLLAQKHAHSGLKFMLIDKTESTYLIAPDRTRLEGAVVISRALLRLCGLDPSDAIQASAVDHWLFKFQVTGLFENKQSFPKLLEELNKHLQYRTYLIGYNVTSADLDLFNKLKHSSWWSKHVPIVSKSPTQSQFVNVYRWFCTMQESCGNLVETFLQTKKQDAQPANESEKKSEKNAKEAKKGTKKAEEKTVVKFDASEDTASWDIGIDPKVWMGRVVTRFPPEPSGYLHIGHAKAVLLNWEVSRRFNGRFLLRFDDTNPSKEKAEFEESILRDLKLLGVTPDSCSHTSDYFAYYIQVCTRLLEEGKAYCDKTPQEKLAEQRLHKQTNEYRTQPIAENLRLWKEMQEGTPEGQQCIVRMKMDMTSDNGTLRDPTLFRVNIDVPHHRTGRKFKAYPTYDFACPIVDSLEGVTHAFRSKEYNERNIQYQQIWSLCCEGQKRPDQTYFECPIIYQFSRQEFTRTELSKRKLSTLIDQGKVKGWNDPRLPTIQGIMRRGLQLEALREFVRDQAMTQRNNKQEWDKLWSYNKKILDPIAGRYYCVSAENKVLVEISNIKENTGVSVQLHPQSPSRGTKVLHVGKEVFIEQFDADLVRKEWDKGKKQFILMSIGVVSVDELIFSSSHPDRIEKLRVTHLPDEKNFKDKTKVTWVVNSENMVWVKLVELDYLFTAEGEPVDQTWFETLAIAEPSISLLSRGDVIQFMKRGFFIVDKPYLGRREDPGVLIFVPDGKSKAMSALSEATNKVEISTR